MIEPDEEEQPDSPETEGENVQERFIGHMGQSGSGKTYALEEDTLERAALPRRMFVVDTKREWSAIPVGQIVCEACVEKTHPDKRKKCQARGQCVIVTDLAAAEKVFNRTGFVVLRPPRDMRMGPQRRDEIPLIERVAKWALDMGDLDLVIPEAHMHFPLEEDASMGVQTRQLITMYRSYGIAIAYDTQFFASLSMRVRKQTNCWRLFGFATGTPDLEQVRKLGGPQLVALIEECAARHAAGEPGWHVYMDPREPPGAREIERY